MGYWIAVNQFRLATKYVYTNNDSYTYSIFIKNFISQVKINMRLDNEIDCYTAHLIIQNINKHLED